MFFTVIRNSFDGVLSRDSSDFSLITRKDDLKWHGLGFQNIRKSAEKYLGSAEYEVKENQFILTVMLQNFADIDQVAEETGKFDFVLADLGVSSMQIDNPDRGFSYKTEGPLDLRMNPKKGISAAQRLKDISVEEFQGMLMENADEPYAQEIAWEVTDRLRRGEEIATTTQLRQAIEAALSFIPEKERREAVKKSSQRTFQALRIDVNNEYEALYSFLEKLPEVLAPNGRVAILTFHSGEDRLVKKSFKRFYKEGIYKEIANEVIRPSQEECIRNSRARSTKMRWAIRAD